MVQLNKIFQNNLYIDPLTGFPTIFKLIESDVNSVFGEQGSIILFDFAGFSKINENYGRDIGDLCLKTLSDSILNALKSYNNSSVFRTDGDEFTLSLPNMSYSKAENLANLIKTDFINIISKHGYSDFQIHTFILDFSQRINSIAEFYKMIFEALLKRKYTNQESSKDLWIDHIIANFIRRIGETLSFFNDAYNLSLTDDISGLFNQRAAKLYLANLMEDSKLSNKEFSLLFIDGDNLKRYNKISYESGNQIIKELSFIILDSVRESDKVFRWLSGDEFLVVLENTDSVNALKIAERIRTSVETQTKICIYPVTVSIGLSSFPHDGSSIEDLISKAEKSNSFAKNTGKNVVVKWRDIM